MPPQGPFAELPEEITLALAEASILLAVLDNAELSARSDEERAVAREAIRIITSKLWPELGDLLGPRGRGVT